MKRILVCFKIVNNFDDVLPGDWQDIGTGEVDTSYTKRMLNCFDESALEMALCLREEYQALGEESELTALTVNPGYADPAYKTLFALCYNQIAVVETEEALRFSPGSTAALLARYAREKGPFDLILTGREAGPGDSGQVPLLLCESLSLPCLTEVTDLHAGPDGVLVQHDVDGGICTQKVYAPAVYAVGNAKKAYLRMPTLREKMAVKGRSPERYAWNSGAGSPARLLGLHREDNARACRFLEGEDMAEKARALYDEYFADFLKEAKA